MTVDKRTPHTDALDTLGTKIDHTARRDAIHLAVEPVEAGQTLQPGDDVAIEGRIATLPRSSQKAVGIVDPFLKTSVAKGEYFWLVVYPRQISSLRHVWEHPSFPLSETIDYRPRNVQESEQWLRDNIDISYETLMESIDNYDGYDYLIIRGEDAYGDIPEDFWFHVETVTGRTFTRKATHFSCYC